MNRNRDMAIPNRATQPTEETQPDIIVESVKQEEPHQEQPREDTTESISKEESEYIEKVFFEEDESVRLRDGVSYKIPPLGLRDAKNLMKKMNTIDTGVIIANLIEDESGNDTFNELLEVLLMAFKPYYKDMTVEYLAEYVDIQSAKSIIDIMIGLNGLKKSL
ncbi:DNA polymerase III subunit gamma/tau [Bacillus haynesii]|uniref:DNA polymerase III subunit gamma/tau n=1 Tax=Bacillus haynesii TaxID=1925021 RepID=UPI00227FF89E|nr:DNA polymerase III subunit gamma/tau [Bacillus haynesii]MCY7861140.1 DNA polymerase III subunit gamma/tau [Bacillus haynesii]MCY8291530.1 DNA polymerase III subunit gamma/tau [Bacillus haynesii]MCY8549154.1 DNA polymerase III subunit gamma/tau [Bacillus haynesii]